jgi:hypothetical protein
MRRRLLATFALLGALVGSVFLGSTAAAPTAHADEDGPGTSIVVNRGW